MATPTRIHSIGQSQLQLADDHRPRAVLTVYKHAVTLKRFTETGIKEYPIDPDELADLLAKEHHFTTGLIPPDTLLVERQGSESFVIGYRKPQITGIWLESAGNSGDKLLYRVPMPGLVMRRKVKGLHISYQIYAVKRRPTSAKERLFHAPLPNVDSHGVCWGTVTKPANPTNDLSADWAAFFGSAFGNHSLINKSKSHPKDIRRLYPDLNDKRKFPLDDLLDCGAFGELVE